MKLRNKRTGEKAEVEINYNSMLVTHEDGRIEQYYFDSLKDLEEWCDYEEPEEYWHIFGTNITKTQEGFDEIFDKKNKEIGNYFESKEEAEKAVEKLKAWHKLMDYWGTEVLGWEIRDMPTGGNWQTVNVKFNVKTRKEPMELLDIVFGGEE